MVNFRLSDLTVYALIVLGIAMRIALSPIIVVILCGAWSLAAEPKHINRLAKESSPYLLQHAHNPVDWYPWDSEAFEKAKKESKLVFLSVGYSACHWCHVMERESFMDAEIAKLLNENFVCIKVDREERPDIDQIYMTAIQITTGHGGWPMSVFLTPDAKPIFGGTYFPARDGDRRDAPGFLTVLRTVQDFWGKERPGLEAQADRITEAIRSSMSAAAGQSTGEGAGLDLARLKTLTHETAQALAQQFDPLHGGFGFVEADSARPKFPEPSNLYFLLERSRLASLSAEERATASRMLTKTLDSMLAGGIFDHLGGGFHRYSTDRFWRIPHFEKMLYDNGQLAQVYALAYEATRRDEYRYAAESICDFAIRELTAHGGAFYASLDADSEGEEGKFYRWSREEIDTAARKIPGFDLFYETFGLKQSPNFEKHFYAIQPGRTLTEIATDRKTTFTQFHQSLQAPRLALLEIRSQRVRPATDEKILTSWNGLMIAGLAESGRILNRKDYLDAAARAAEFILKELRTPQGRLLRTYAAGRAKLNGYLDDYAFLVYGLLRLHQATSQPRWLDSAVSLTDTQISFFQDEKAGNCYYTSSDHPELILRFSDPVDGATPSGNSVTAANLLYLVSVAKLSRYEKTLEQTLRAAEGLLEKNPSACPLMSAQMAGWLEAKSKL